jgi:hypothetical protein
MVIEAQEHKGLQATALSGLVNAAFDCCFPGDDRERCVAVCIGLEYGPEWK